jgi:hypothetical protein
VLESEFVEYLRTLRPDERTAAEFPEVASKVWARRNADATAIIKKLKTSLEEQKRLKAELLRAKLRGEVSQADYVQANSEFDSEIDALTQQLHPTDQHGTIDVFLRFTKLMLVDVTAAWQIADAEQRLRVQNFLFQTELLTKKPRSF